MQCVHCTHFTHASFTIAAVRFYSSDIKRTSCSTWWHLISADSYFSCNKTRQVHNATQRWFISSHKTPAPARNMQIQHFIITTLLSEKNTQTPIIQQFINIFCELSIYNTCIDFVMIILKKNIQNYCNTAACSSDNFRRRHCLIPITEEDGHSDTFLYILLRSVVQHGSWKSGLNVSSFHL